VIVQPTFYIPPDIATGLLSGDLIRYGGVVRDTAGRLVVHLNEVPTPERTAQEVARVAVKGIKNPWVAVGAGMLIVMAVGGGVVLAVKRRKKDAKPEVPECVTHYNESLKTYLEAIHTGSLDPEIIDRLISDLDAVKSEAEESDTNIAFSTEQLETLTEVVVGYTTKLAEANAIELDAPGQVAEGAMNNVLADLRQYLEVQKRIFEEAA
jgi:hypothetical protein